MEGNMANRGGGRCDGHHKIVDCKIRHGEHSTNIRQAFAEDVKVWDCYYLVYSAKRSQPNWRLDRRR
jgi:hypothetical protein